MSVTKFRQSTGSVMKSTGGYEFMLTLNVVSRVTEEDTVRCAIPGAEVPGHI